MKNKIILFLNFLFISVAVYAQPVITSGILPVNGDTIILALDTILQPPGNSGANVTWDFSQLQQHILSSRIYLDPASTPYSSEYPNATLSRTDAAGSVYTFWKNEGNTSTYFGFVEPGVYDQNYNSLPVKYYKFPINFGDSFTDSLYASTNPGNIQGAGKYYFNADGWGILKLPHRTVQNVLRTKSVLYIGDSTINSFSLTKEFAWYSPDQKDALLVISSVLLNGSLYRKFVFYDNHSVTGINKIERSDAIDVYPNPNTGIFTVYIGNANRKCIVECYDAEGRLQLSKETESDHVVIDLTPYGKGLYLVKIKNEGSELIKKVIVE